MLLRMQSSIAVFVSFYRDKSMRLHLNFYRLSRRLFPHLE